ncbi:hypothetical protein BP5796_02136 [Coleophoma crateriformis]|uniref:DUF7708 domain-containing protein n=1 Tax=Coleophoma crateriformis TaxID=565419 RepID=A0A3D8SXS5_9HELO|nr:hypothetical protein BP5796_02136 [Coleophoma crateriformis]
MDVMVQHHPEYTSLAWGAIKILFVGVVNHQSLLVRLSTGLCQIADMLPRASLILQLYPTSQMKNIIVTLYAHVLRFLLRALRWYQEGRIKHAVHAITSPAELRYDDLLKKIFSLSDSMKDLALASSHTEQRDMHMKIQQCASGQLVMQTSIDRLTAIVLELQRSVSTEQTINASARIKLHQSLSEIQLVQFLDLLSVSVALDPARAFQASLFMRNRRRLRPSNYGPSFWLDSKMQRWNESHSSSLVLVNGTRKLRFHMKDFCTNSILALQKSQTPVIWVLKTMSPQEEDDDGMVNQVSTIELLKCLISQAVRINRALHTDAALTPRMGAYVSAKTEEEWFGILGSVLQGVPLLYIIIDVELLHPSLAEMTDNFSWPAAFLELFAELAQRNIKTVIKIVLVSYGSPLFKKQMSKECQELVVSVGTSVRTPLGRARTMIDGSDSRIHDHTDAKHRLGGADGDINAGENVTDMLGLFSIGYHDDKLPIQIAL